MATSNSFLDLVSCCQLPVPSGHSEPLPPFLDLEAWPGHFQSLVSEWIGVCGLRVSDDSHHDSNNGRHWVAFLCARSTLWMGSASLCRNLARWLLVLPISEGTLKSRGLG